MNAMSETAAQVIAAYGGALWRKARRFSAVVSARGLAFTLKRRIAFDYATISGEVQHPRLRLAPIGRRPDVACVLEGGDVRLEDAAGAVLERRADARRFFPGGRRAFYWDDLDMGYFASYAFWNYFTLPALLMNDEIHWEECAPGHLRAHFPTHIPSHCPVQDFFFDLGTGLLKRHDYVAQVIGGWARAAHVIEAHDAREGLSYPARRRVTPQAPYGQALPFPTLIAIEVHEFALEVQ
jgi:hypothetical protein